eukprot:11287742-Alexandrium_andersonii.AAC.1
MPFGQRRARHEPHRAPHDAAVSPTGVHREGLQAGVQEAPEARGHDGRPRPGLHGDQESAREVH